MTETSAASVLCTHNRTLGNYSVECKLVELNGQFVFHRKRSIGTTCFDINNTIINSVNLVKKSANVYILYIDDNLTQKPYVFTLDGTMHTFAECFASYIYGQSLYDDSS